MYNPEAKPLWLLQNNGINRVTENIAKVLNAQNRRFLDISVHSCETFESDLDHRLAEEGLDVWAQPTFFMGSVLMLEAVLKSEKYKSLAHYNPDHFETPMWVEKLGNQMLNATYEESTLEAAANCEQPVFVRPLAAHKLFTGALICKETFPDWFFQANQRNPKLTLDSKVCMSTPRTILKEWRVICVNGQPRLWSSYKDGSSLSVSADIEANALLFAQQVAKQWVPGQLCTLDVAKTPAGYKVVEFNGVHCCGIYAIEPTQFVGLVDDFLTGQT